MKEKDEVVWLSGMSQWEENKPRFESTLAELPPLLTAGVYGQGLVSSSSPIVKVAKWLMLLPIRMQIHAGIDSVTLVLSTYVRTSQTLESQTTVWTRMKILHTLEGLGMGSTALVAALPSGMVTGIFLQGTMMYSPMTTTKAPSPSHL